MKKLAFLLLLVLTVAACGQKGRLYLPDTETEDDEQSTSQSTDG